MNVSEAVLSYVSRVIHLVFGSKRLRHYEQVCIAAWRSTLSAVLQKKLDKQLEKFDLVQRQANGLKSVFYSLRDPQYTTWKEDDLFPVLGEEQKVFTGTLIGNIEDVTESVKFSVYLHKGRLSSIEFVSEPGALASLSKGLLIDGQKTLVDLERDKRGHP
ncbi:MAG: hypothetical protein ABW098_06065 [Candidatus Thiodiazotropha sp.]